MLRYAGGIYEASMGTLAKALSSAGVVGPNRREVSRRPKKS